VIDIERLCTPVSAEAPCGSDLEYDADFLSLEKALQGKPEQQFGETIVPAEEPDWREVFSLSEALFARTKDLRIAVTLIRAALRTGGFSTYYQGLVLIQQLCETYWENLFPVLDPDYDNDPAMRMNTLSSLSHIDAGLLDLRESVIAKSRGDSLLVKDVEVALGLAPAINNATTLSEADVLSLLRDAAQQDEGLLDLLIKTKTQANALQTFLNEKVGSDQAADLKPVRDLLNAIAKVALNIRGSDENSSNEQLETEDINTSNSSGQARGVGEVRSREDAVRALSRVCEYLERNEPTNPAQLFIKRAQRLMTMNFVDIIQELVPDSMNQVETLTGIRRE